MYKLSYKICFLFILFNNLATAQALLPHHYASAADIQLGLKKMQTVGTVLYVAAHPDDENTRLIAYLSKEKCLRTAYLSLTRGDGGQNLIGSQVGEYLGLIRTQELLEARKMDGAEQYFTRANDFGFSKNAEETQQLWNKQQVLADVVWTIRKLQPDVIITRFDPKSSGKTHGHHTTSAILAKEAFRLAADPNAFPEQLQYVQTWQAKRIFWNTSAFFFQNGQMDKTQLLKIRDAGKYNFLLGKSYGEIAIESRTMHQSQGMGRLRVRGESTEYLQFLDGQEAKNDAFEGIDLSWERIENGQEIAKSLKKAYQNFEPENPESVLPYLLWAYKKMDKLPKNNANQNFIAYKKKELAELIRQISGLWFEVISDNYLASPSEKINLSFNFIKSAKASIKLSKIKILATNSEILADSVLKTNVYREIKKKFALKNDLTISQPYWLEKDFSTMYQVDNQELIGLPENNSATKTIWTFDFDGTSIDFEQSILFKWNEEVTGEFYRNLEITPQITGAIQEKVLLFSKNSSKKIGVLLKNHADSSKNDISLTVPKDWRVVPEKIELLFSKKGEEKQVFFEVFPPKEASQAQITLQINGQDAKNLVRIDYPHIPIQTIFPKASLKAVRLDIKTIDQKIGYYVGAGDEIAENLRQVGYDVTELTDENFDKIKLSQFGTIITGVRAYNVRKRAAFDHQKLLEFVKNGGNLIVQYNTNWGLSEGMKNEQTGVFPFEISRDRVTDENSEIKFTNPEHKILNFPNKITSKDFENWVQERGVYFAKNWDKNYQTLVLCQDPNESPSEGGIITASYGKGTYIYTGFSWFRQLPAGVSGSYRIFANLISFKQ